nr:molybdenum cofactor sulfurase-like [Ipomoea batatas]GMD02220.1 molybdenum cofactor sulfurase-like [Ipomoea batatas]
MKSPCLREVEQVFQGCCLNPPFRIVESPQQKVVSMPRNIFAVCHPNFADTTASSFFPNTLFTNHESLPSLQESFVQFIKAYPQYSETCQIDKIRAQEYHNLSHVCLDYNGIGLFSDSQLQSQLASSSSPSPQSSNFPVFDVSFKAVNLKSQLLHGGQGSDLESAIKQRIMDYLKISQNEYCMVFTANRSSAFKLLAESYPFGSSRKLLTVYDHESEALRTMVDTSEKRGACIASAEFKWPRLRVNSARLRKMIVRKKNEKNSRGLFVFPLQSRVTGARYSYQWMSLAQENGWHVLLDACALGPKDMDSLGLSLCHPDFLVCSFYKVLGSNPTGFGCLIVKKSVVSILEASTSAGIVTLVPPTQLLRSLEDSSGTDKELEQMYNIWIKADDKNASNSSTCSISAQHSSGKSTEGNISRMKGKEFVSTFTDPEHSGKEKPEESIASLHQILELEGHEDCACECRYLDQVDSLGMRIVNNRQRYLINWLITAVMKLQHPNRLECLPLVKIYGPRIKFDRGAALAFNLYDWKGKKVDPTLVQKLADRNNISLSHGFLHQIWFPDKYDQEMGSVLEKRESQEKEEGRKRSKKAELGIAVVTIALNFLTNFEDIYRLWAFIAQFLDADFVEKESWRYTALNQKTMEV